MTTPNKKQRANLRKLSAYLAALPADYEHFDMGYFYAVERDNDILEPNPSDRKLGLNHCGTSACAIGHGPAAGIRVYGDCTWCAYCERVFGITYPGIEFVDLFGCKNPDCPRQAAARIDTYLAALGEVA